MVRIVLRALRSNDFSGEFADHVNQVLMLVVEFEVNHQALSSLRDEPTPAAECALSDGGHVMRLVREFLGSARCDEYG
ncbi:hypothetical protein GCM10017709_02730 [Glutamicibacter nicotianae]|uniref:Uncharacterized protein n=1 Tax=Glutamicibacter nicotianae TaxID=37929 RepID=A0ABQ0RL60_GLUNI|nr:hypothetical protein ANI01nite_17410 [Glutamicibacter nicotianae]